jgi:hypothetical protein
MELWISRNPNGVLKLFNVEPVYDEFFETWETFVEDGFVGYLDEEEVPEVTFENSPRRVGLKLL